MSSPEQIDRDSGRRRFLKQAGAFVAAVPVVAALEAAAATAPAKTKPAAPAAAAPPPSGDPFPGARPDASIARNAEERAALERRWKTLQETLQVIRTAPLDPATEPATAFAALALPPKGRRTRDDDEDGED
jgi:hypothetical protein